MQRSFRNIIEQDALPLIQKHVQGAVREKELFYIDGIQCFTPKDFVIAGKIVDVYSKLAELSNPAAPEAAEFLQEVKEIIEFTANLQMATWGTYFYVMGIYHLERQGILQKVPLSDQTIENLKKKLDWRTFVDEKDMTLIGSYPTNYYGVAFRIAIYREMLGWDTPGFAETFLNKLLDHFARYSGKLLFMDETAGHGRYDTYSMAIPAEICTTLLDVGKPVPPMVVAMLRNSSEIYLQLANGQGNGFSYGRSIGMLGDGGAFLLALAARLDLLSPDEKRLAYAYNVKIAEKVFAFWLDESMNSVNLWEKGRRADKYRHKNRILEINLGILYKLIETASTWKSLGFDYVPDEDEVEKRCERLPRYRYFSFSEQDFSRGLAIIRDGNHVFSLPFSNVMEGGSVTPYLPIPNENRVLETSPFTIHPQLVPFITLKNGLVLAPIAYTRAIRTEENLETYQINYEQDAMAVLDQQFPPPQDQRVASKTIVHFHPGVIEREETLIPQSPLDVEEIRLEFATFSEKPEVQGNRVIFAHGPIQEIELRGLESPTIELVAEQELYHTSHGALQVKLCWKKGPFIWKEPLAVFWRLKYART